MSHDSLVAMCLNRMVVGRLLLLLVVLSMTGCVRDVHLVNPLTYDPGFSYVCDAELKQQEDNARAAMALIGLVKVANIR
jgi:hypothetical protein